MADQRRYGAYPGFRGYAASIFKRLPRERKLEVMQNWFGGHYEDPANRVSYNTREGGYLWVPGLGPHDADNEIQEEFSDVADFDLMMEAVEEVQSNGILDWASKDYFRQIDDEAVRERDEEDQERFPFTIPMPLGGRPTAGTAPIFSDASGGGPTAGGPYAPRGVFEPGVFEPGIFEEGPLDEATARREMLEHLARLEQMVTPLVAHVGMMGHNGPPGPIEDPELPERQPDPNEPPLTARDIAAIARAIGEVRREADSGTPNVAVIEANEGILARAGGYLLRLCDMAAQEGAKAFGKWVGTAAAVGVAGVVASFATWGDLGQALQETAASISTWVQTLPW